MWEEQFISNQAEHEMQVQRVTIQLKREEEEARKNKRPSALELEEHWKKFVAQ